MTQYIDKSVLISEINRIMNEQQEICKTNVALGKNPNSKNIEVIYQFQQFIKILDTIEVKEVDLDEEITIAMPHRYSWSGDGSTMLYTEKQMKDFAKHFFELGLKAQKGE